MCQDEIACFKFHYTMEKGYKFNDRSESVLRFLNEASEVEIHNYQQTHQGLKLTRSGAGFKLNELQGFMYGPFSSRFWSMRKYINSAP